MLPLASDLTATNSTLRPQFLQRVEGFSVGWAMLIESGKVLKTRITVRKDNNCDMVAQLSDIMTGNE